MAKHQIKTQRIVEPGSHFSQAVTIEANGKLVFVSGMTARRPDGTVAGIGDIEEQTRQACENIKSAVEAAGGTIDDVCRVDVYLKNIGDRERVQKVRRQFWRATPPASTLVEVSKLASPQFLIEISAIALIQNSSAIPPPV